MFVDNQECDVVVTAVAPVGYLVDADGHDGFIDQVKHPSWWSDVPRAEVGDRMRAVVLDPTRTPARFSALPLDVRIARSLRHTEPLRRLCPAPPPDEVRGVEWAVVEEALGTALPADYKRLVDTYGGGVFAGTIWLLEPDCPDRMYDLLAQTAEREEIRARFREVGEAEPAEILDGDVRLVPWGYAEGAGHVLYWVVRPGVEPEEWTVVLQEGRGPFWEAHEVSCSRFLLDVVAGTTTSYYFSDDEHDDDHEDGIDAEDRFRFIPGSRFHGGTGAPPADRG